jgi:flagellar protein FliO/FliZ
MSRILRAVCLTFMWLSAVPPLQAHPTAGTSSLEQFSSVGLNLLVVLAVIAAVTWYARRSPLLNPGRSKGPMKIVATLPIGPKERIVLIEAGTQRLLVGVSPAGMFQLGSSALPEPVDDAQSFERLL